MMSCNTFQLLIRLCKAALTDDKTISENFPAISEREWKKLMHLSFRNGCNTLVTHATTMLPAELKPTIKQRVHLATGMMLEGVRHRNTDIAITSFFRMVTGPACPHPLSLVLLGGQALSWLYPIPHSRPLSEVCIAIQADQLPTLIQILESNNIANRQGPDYVKLTYRGCEIIIIPEIHLLPTHIFRLNLNGEPSPTGQQISACTSGLKTNSTLLLSILDKTFMETYAERLCVH